MTQVYVVTRGDYSDYHIEEIFSTREKAQTYIDLINNKHNFYGRVNDDIEEYELDRDLTLPKSPHKFETFYSVEIDRNGNIVACRETGYDVFHPEESQEHYRLWLKKEYNEQTGRFDIFYVLNGYDVNANSEEHAIKKMGEKRQYLLRTDKWPSEYKPGMGHSIEVM